MSPDNSVAVWRQTWLPGSETFIRNQVDTMTRWTPRPVALEYLESSISAGGSIIFGGGPVARLRRRAFRELRWSPAVTRALSAANPRLIHAHFATDAGLIVPIARRLKVPLVLTVHGYDLTAVSERTRRDRRHVADALKRVDSVVALSRFMADRAIAQGADASRVVTIPTGIPIPPDPGLRRASGDAVQVLFVGRLVEKKGVGDAVRSVAALADAGHRVGLTIAGGGPLEEQLRHEAARMRAPVEFVGPVTPTAVRELMRTHDVFLAPSRTATNGDAEGFGMVFLEAAAQRLPTVAYAHGGVPEAVAHGRTGYLAPEGDVDQLGRYLEELVVSAAQRNDFGLAGRRRVERDFDIERCTDLLEDHYDSIAIGR